MTPRLAILSGPKAGQVVELPREGELVIGREAGCGLTIEDATVSRRHAAVRVEGGRSFVRDLGSRNGIRVQGRKVESAEIAPGDVFHVGSIQLRLVVEPPGAAAPSAPAAAPARRRIDFPAVALGLGILAALWILWGALDEETPPEIEVVVLAVDEEKYYSLDGPIRAVGPLSPPGIAAAEGEPGQSALVLSGLEEGRTDLPVELEEGPVLLKIQVVERPLRRRRADVSPEEALPAAQLAMSEGEAAARHEALLLVAVQRFREAVELFEAAGAGETDWTLAKDRHDEARRRLRAARQDHESAFFLAVKQRNANRARDEALIVLNLIDPAEDSLGYQKWSERIEKLGVAPGQIPMRLEQLRRTAR